VRPLTRIVDAFEDETAELSKCRLATILLQARQVGSELGRSEFVEVERDVARTLEGVGIHRRRCPLNRARISDWIPMPADGAAGCPAFAVDPRRGVAGWTILEQEVFDPCVSGRFTLEIARCR